MHTICTICARGGSKGLPGKNIRLLKGKPLIAYSIEQALNSKLFECVYVSTDSQLIAEIAREHGAIVPFIRPKELADDGASKIAVIQHLVSFLEGDGRKIEKIVDLDPTSPLREIDDIRNALNLLQDEVDVVITQASAHYLIGTPGAVRPTRGADAHEARNKEVSRTATMLGMPTLSR